MRKGYSIIMVMMICTITTTTSFADDSYKFISLINTVNSGINERIEKFIKSNYDSLFLTRIPVNMQVEFVKGFYYQSNRIGYEITGETEILNGKIIGEVKNLFTGITLIVYMPINSESEKINGFIEFKPVNRKNEIENIDAFTTKLGNVLQLMNAEDAFSGAVLICRNQKQLYSNAFGEADKSNGIKNKIDTKFNIASVGKMFTSVAIAILVQKGKISFDDYVDKYLGSEWLDPELAKQIKIKNLLTHTSGLGDYFEKMNSSVNSFPFRELNDYKSLMNDQKLKFTPGTKWSYSNTGMLLLGVIIERVSGLEYFEFLEENIFKLAGMKNTGGFEKDSPVENRATGYYKIVKRNEIAWRDNSISRVAKGTPSGGCFSTVEDLSRFWIALNNNNLLGEKLKEEILKPKPELNSTFYGYGFYTGESIAGKYIKHTGDGTGISCQFIHFVDKDITVIILSNYNRPAADIAAGLVEQLIAGL